jgi:hypothetical protein
MIKFDKSKNQIIKKNLINKFSESNGKDNSQ